MCRSGITLLKFLTKKVPYSVYNGVEGLIKDKSFMLTESRRGFLNTIRLLPLDKAKTSEIDK